MSSTHLHSPNTVERLERKRKRELIPGNKQDAEVSSYEVERGKRSKKVKTGTTNMVDW